MSFVMETRQEKKEGRTGTRRDTAAPHSSEQKLEDSTCETRRERHRTH